MRYLLLTALACLAAAPLLRAQVDVDIDTKPGDAFVVHCDGASVDWKVRPIRIQNKDGAVPQGATQEDFRPKAERWATGRSEVKRYHPEAALAAFKKFTGANAEDGARFYFNAWDPNQPRAEGKVTMVDEHLHVYWSPASAIHLVSYPRTWVDIYEAYVAQKQGDERRVAVKEWEAAHRDLIENKDFSPDGFTQQERNDFARFYQAQFIYVRDRNPQLASIYEELAEFHRNHNNLDAELSTYLDGLRAGVPSPAREEFALDVGRIFVERLNLFGEAVQYLDQARNHTEALYLLARCHYETGDYAKAREELNGLVNTLGPWQQSDPTEADNLYLESAGSGPAELSRANLMLARIAFKQLDYAAAESALALIPQGDVNYDAGRVLYCTMLLQRNEPRRQGEKSDSQKIREILKDLSFWPDAQKYLTPSDSTEFPLDPLMARAMLLYAQTDSQFSQPRPEDPAKPSDDALRYIQAAKALDPLSPEPYYAEGRLDQRCGQFVAALAAYKAGLNVNPTHVLLNYSVAELEAKAGVFSEAKDYLGRCLKYAPDFYPAHSMLGELAIEDFERVRESLLVRMAAGAKVDFAGELVPQMKEAAAFFTSSLAINDNQPDTKLQLATLMLRLSELAPLVTSAEAAPALKQAYLVKARDLAKQLIDKLEEFAKQDHPSKLTEREVAAIPSLACYNVYAYALYALKDYQGARDAFQQHIEKARSKQYIPDSRMRKDYEQSSAIAYAQDWVQRIEQNMRQYYKEDDFPKDSTPNYYGTWSMPVKLKPDPGFAENTRIRGGKLYLEVNQQKSGVVSRFETEQPHATLSTFEAHFTRTGDMPVDRGIYLTRAIKPTSHSTSEGDPRCSVFLGVDADGRVFWETHKYDLDDRDNVDKREEYGLIDVSLYGQAKLDPNAPLTLALRRQLNKDGSRVDYVAIINGYEVRLPVNTDRDGKKHISELQKNDFNQGRYAVNCGFFTRGLAGAKGSVEVDKVKFIYDSNLGGR